PDDGRDGGSLPRGAAAVSARRWLARPGSRAAAVAVRARTSGWRPHSHLFAVGDSGGWSVDEDARHLEQAAERIGVPIGPARWARFASTQSVFLTSHFEALEPRWLDTSHPLATADLHRRPGTPGYPEFASAFGRLRAAPGRFSRVQVTHAEMRDLVCEAGVDPASVHVIPIGIDLENFPIGDRVAQSGARHALDVPETAFVVGSFQKDGVGWGEGREPKLVKGPDVLVAALARIRDERPETFVLLTPPPPP